MSQKVQKSAADVEIQVGENDRPEPTGSRIENGEDQEHGAVRERHRGALVKVIAHLQEGADGSRFPGAAGHIDNFRHDITARDHFFEERVDELVYKSYDSHSAGEETLSDVLACCWQTR